jgi:hypothetical protein
MHKILIQILRGAVGGGEGASVEDSLVVRATCYGMDGPGIPPQCRARDVPYQTRRPKANLAFYKMGMVALFRG